MNRRTLPALVLVVCSIVAACTLPSQIDYTCQAAQRDTAHSVADGDTVTVDAECERTN